MPKKTYYTITIGCQMNKSDSERIAGYLDGLGYTKANNIKKSDIAIITTCGVRQSAEDRIYGLIPAIKKGNQKIKIILTGCLSERLDVIKKLQKSVDIFLPITKLPELAGLLHEKKPELEVINYLKISPNYNSCFSAFVPIGNGCNNFCAYCVVPYARGREVYREAKDIFKEVEHLVFEGYREIILIAQNVNSYTSIYKNKEMDFSDLLLLINEIKGDYWLRFATSHPKDMSAKLIETIKNCPRICRHIHLPAQSGDNEILRAMNRKYTREDYLALINKIRKALPSVSITTDIIVGFPGETKSQFLNSAKLFKQVGFDMAYVAQYSPRPGTSAYALTDNVKKDEKKRREDELMKILAKTALNNNQKYLNQEIIVLVDAISKKGYLVGKNEANKVIRIKLPNNIDNRQKYIGKFVKVKVYKAEDFGLMGEIV